MTKWGTLRNSIIWPSEFAYAVENAGQGNKFGHSYVVKYNGNVVHSRFKKGLNRVSKLMKVTQRVCEKMEQQNYGQDVDALEADNLGVHTGGDSADQINEANQILLRLNEKKEFFKETLDKINTIDEKYDIAVSAGSAHYALRLDSPFVFIEGDPLVEALKRGQLGGGVKQLGQRGEDRRGAVKQGRKGEEGRGARAPQFRTFLYNAKIIECDQTLIGDREFIFSEANTSNLKVNTLINEGKRIRQALYEYKESCGVESEVQNNQDDIPPNGRSLSGSVKRTTTTPPPCGKDEVTYESVGVLPYSDIIMVQKSEFNKKSYVAAFLTPFVLNGNVKGFIEKVQPYMAYQFDSNLILGNLCKLIKLMCHLEEKNILHGNIKPTNLFIDNSGFNILLGNFVPKVKLTNYFHYVINGRRGLPRYISPELFSYLRKKKNMVKNGGKKNKHIERYLVKNDIFCLGLCFYYIVTMKEDILNHVDDPHAFQHKVHGLQACVSRPDVFLLLRSMLTYDHRQRPTWEALLAAVRGEGYKTTR
ncbi:serine/threonine protein kinase [Plasmodium fragile]|uniref:Serine/threonine protein kinase n=1 Tax=Plasmodium fragile TaxID=5857 RepID=A0A0D9QH13_PLAFR|nr:serine/threonine protein kinase [Plasmodium fragile]KJP86304.1 serine/threonine protein kinase [Plasmodium fragile]